MRIAALEYHDPDSLDEACRLMAAAGGDARLVAGGTDVLADLKQGLLRASCLVSLQRIAELRRIERHEGGLRLGPLCTANALADSAEVRALLPALADAAGAMAGYPIRNLATIGGNLCSAVPSADLPPALLVVDAELELVCQAGARHLPVARFFVGPRKTERRPEEILAAIRVPALPPATGSAYERFQLRQATALAVVGVAARLTLASAKPGARIARGGLAVSAAAPTPLFVEEAAAFLCGKPPSEETFAGAAALVAQAVRPISDLRATAEYRRHLASVLAVRALRRAAARAAAAPRA
jgi:carbon-monoxide dehydrogenase medium subunit